MPEPGFVLSPTLHMLRKITYGTRVDIFHTTLVSISVSTEKLIMQLIENAEPVRLEMGDPSAGDFSTILADLIGMAYLSLQLPRAETTGGFIYVHASTHSHHINLEIFPQNRGLCLQLTQSVPSELAASVPALPALLYDALETISLENLPKPTIYRQLYPSLYTEPCIQRLLKRLTFRSHSMIVDTHLGPMKTSDIADDVPAARLAAKLVDKGRELGVPWIDFRYEGQWDIVAAGGEVLMSPPNRLYPSVFAWLCQLQLSGKVRIGLEAGCMCRIHISDS